MVTIRIPAPSSLLVANVVGVLGLVAVVLAIGGLAGGWWAALVGGLCLVGLSAIALTHVADTTASTAGQPAPAVAAATAAVPVATIGEQQAA